MMKFVHALNAAVVYIGMEKFGNAQTVTTQRKTKKEKIREYPKVCVNLQTDVR